MNRLAGKRHLGFYELLQLLIDEQGSTETLNQQVTSGRVTARDLQIKNKKYEELQQRITALTAEYNGGYGVYGKVVLLSWKGGVREKRKWSLIDVLFCVCINILCCDNTFVSNILDTVIGYSWMMIDRMFGDRDVMQLNLCYASYKTVVHRGVCNSVLFSENVELLPPYFYTVSSDQSNHHVQVQVIKLKNKVILERLQIQ
ncbi:hypothetical protein Tsp_01292 [Trichinella spiralis]|uniref:hypothetical protein n=1 Tax=Trichinella spiralis TaxID=6334 RepID=UPI0001EFCC75|nr:hypothetical protein Tsp_01292 [Trichinella spiralis]